MLIKYKTKNFGETQKLGEKFAKEILKIGLGKTATVLGLSGNLGSGKTTFLQGFAKGLNINNKILSPTFIIYRKFQIPKPNDQPNPKPQTPKFKNFYHFDLYRIKNSKDILELGFNEIIKDPKNIVAIEWPKRIKKILPKNTIFLNFKFISENTRAFTCFLFFK